MQDFLIDQGATFSWISVQLYDPVRRGDDSAPVPLLPFIRRTGHDSDMLFQMMGNIPHYVPDVRPDTDRVVVEVNTRDELIYLTATLRDGKSQIRARGDGCDPTPIWAVIVDYLTVMGWVDARPLPAAEQASIETGAALEVLSEEERETLQLIVDGLEKDKIALTLGVGVEAIKKRQRQMADKLGIEGKATERVLRTKGLEFGMKPSPEAAKRFPL